MGGYRKFLLTAVLVGMLFATTVHGERCGTNICGTNAKCSGFLVLRRCVCPSSYIGDPLVECMRMECNIDDDCPTNKACSNNECIDPQLVFCDRNSQCSTSSVVPTSEYPTRNTDDPDMEYSATES